MNDFYNGNPNIKADGVQMEYTEEQVQEYIRCMNDPVYFCNKYLKVVHVDKGLVPFKLYPYQEEMFNHFNDNRFSIVLSCRQSGKSTSMVGYTVWYCIFHSEKTVAILANKAATAREMLDRFTKMIENLPFWLQPGARTVNKGSLEFSNGTKILAAATSGSSIRGLSISLLLLDEFAFVERSEEFYTSTYPVISSGKESKVIIVSTPNGIGNMFHKLWQGAIQGVNEYKPFTINWFDVPGRDEKWKEETIANTSEIQFKQEFEVEFLGTGATLINAETLLGLQARAPIRTDDHAKIYEQPIPGHQYIMTVDVAKGVGGDYSTFNIIDVTARPFKQVAVYRNNKLSPILFPTVIEKYGKLYNYAYVIIENNDIGFLVCKTLWYDLEYENMHVESMMKSTGLGVMMTRKVKRLGCSGFKDLLEKGKLEIFDEDTILEVSTFEEKGNSYEAAAGNHDDLVMNLVMFAYFAGTDDFYMQTDINLKEEIFKQQIEQIEKDLAPIGFFDGFNYDVSDDHVYEYSDFINKI